MAPGGGYCLTLYDSLGTLYYLTSFLGGGKESKTKPILNLNGLQVYFVLEGYLY